MHEIEGFLKAAGWGTAAAAAGLGGAALFGAGAYMGAKVQRKVTRAVVGTAVGSTVGPLNKPEDSKAEEPMKTAGIPLVIGAGLVGAGAVVGAKAQKALSRGPIMKADAFRSQVRQKQLERQGTFAS